MKKKILSLLTAFAMVFGIIAAPFTSAKAETDAKKTRNTTVNIYKILMDENKLDVKKVTVGNETKYIYEKTVEGVKKYYNASDDTEVTDQAFITAFANGEKVFAGKVGVNGEEYKGQQLNIKNYFGKGAKPIEGVAFRIYQVYEGKETNPTGYTKGSELKQTAKLASTDLDDNTLYKLIQVVNKDFVTTNAQGFATATLPKGKYRIVEDKNNSTYRGDNGTLTRMEAIPIDLTLPMGLPDGTGYYNNYDKPLHLYPKNTENKVKFDKNFAKDNGLEKITDPKTLKDVGAVFANYATEKANVKGQIGKPIPYETKAQLPKGSVFKNLHLRDAMDRGLEYDSTKGITVAVEPNTVTLEKDKDYTITNEANGFALEFTETGLAKLNKAAEDKDVTVTFTYQAKVTTEAVDDQPMDNHATITYNHTPPVPSSDTVTPKNEKITVEKDWADGNVPAGVKVKYVLLDEDSKPLADVTFKEAKTVDRTDLGNGIKFAVNQNKDFSGEFTGLKANKKYKIKEIVDGYEPEYEVKTDDGKVIVKNKKTPDSITPTPPQVTVGGKKFVKTDEKGNNRLAGAEFIIQNKNATDTTNNGKYLKIVDDGNAKTAYATAKEAYDAAIEAVNKALAKGEISATNKVTIGTNNYTTKDDALAAVNKLFDTMQEKYVESKLNYTWVEEKDKATATKFYTNKDGQFEVTGLAYGTYRAVETKAPAGYAVPTNGGNFEFTVGEGSYYQEADGIDYKPKDTTVKAKKIINNKVTIPQTGGIGSLIFIVAGVAIMAFAFVAYKRSEAREA